MVDEDGERPKLPQALKDLSEKAIARHERRPATPRIKVTLDEGKWWFDSPYSHEHEEQWVALMFDAFGTRSQAAFRCFMIQLSELCSNEWDKDAEGWQPNEDELTAAVQIVRSTKPRNEAEACLAAQLVAVHLMQMKLSAQAIRYDCAEPRTCAIAGKLARTYAMLLETMAKLKGKGARQRITVKKYAQHEHKHIHLHPGDIQNGDRPHEPKQARRDNEATIGQSAVRAALPGPDQGGDIVPMPSPEGTEQVSASRRRGGSRRSQGHF